MDKVNDLQLKRLSNRDYKCPCGKTYLSYAALFTHIKQKHNGKAPGQIEKPNLEKRPRGRPPLIAKNKPVQEEKNLQNSKDTFTSFEEVEKNKNYYTNFATIFSLLNGIVSPQQIGLRIWSEVGSFKKLEEFIDMTGFPQKNSQDKVSLGTGVSQFLKHISLQTDSWKFQQVLILFMLLMQYVIDESNFQGIIEQAQVDILVQFMNPFINYHIQDYADYLGISHLWVLQKNNIQSIFNCFYNWLKWKEYTEFCITLID